MKVSQEFVVGNNTFYVNVKHKCLIIDDCDEKTDNSVYICFEDLEKFIEVYNSIKDKGHKNNEM